MSADLCISRDNVLNKHNHPNNISSEESSQPFFQEYDVIRFKTNRTKIPNNHSSEDKH